MVDEIETLRRRVERERRARKQAEQIAETKSRELFLKGQETERAFYAEQMSKKGTEVLLRALETFTTHLETKEILAYLARFTKDAFPGVETTIHCRSGSGLVVLEDVTDHQSLTPLHFASEEHGDNPVASLFNDPIMIIDLDGDDRLRIFGLHVSIRSLMVLPIRVAGSTLGYMTVESREAQAFEENNLRFAQSLVKQAVSALDLTRLFREVERLSMTDPLTKLYNRRHLDTVADRLVWLATRHERPLTVLMLDLDHFKQINDKHGHASGDLVLVGLAELCRSTLRATDLCVRLGGEEFCVVLPETDADGALVVAERIRVRFADLSFDGGVEPFTVTMSIGIAEFTGKNETFSNLLECADQALYRAKKAGRNRIVM